MDTNEPEPTGWTQQQQLRLARETEFELAQLQRDFGTQPPWTECAIAAAMDRMSLRYAASCAAWDGRLLLSWLLRRRIRKISPAYMIKKGYRDE